MTTMKTASLELACGPDDRRCVIQLTFEPDQDEFIDCSVRIQLPPQLNLDLSGFLFYSQDFERLLAAFDSNGAALSCPVIDSDCLLTIKAEEKSNWTEWSIEWEGIYPVFPPCDPDQSANSKILIRGLRAHWSPF